MKIAIDIRAAGGEKAGKGWYAFNIVRALLRLDQKNKYILYTKDKFPGFDEFDNAHIRQIGGRGLFWHLNVLRDVRREKVDLFFAPTSYIVPALLPRSIRTILTVHDLVAFLFPATHNKKAVLIERLFFRRALKKADHICAVSENTRQDILEKFHLDRHKISTVYCASSNDFKPLKKANLTAFIKKTNLPDKFFLAVGTQEPRKNYINLIAAFTCVHKKHPDYHLIIVGGRGWDYEKIHSEIRENYLGKKVHLLGYLSGSSLEKLYSLARALVFPSIYEGFGIPPLEAMQCGCPVIASSTSSIPEVVGESALLVNPENSDEIANAMLKLIKDDDLCEKLRNRGLTQAKKFSWEKSAAKLLEVIRRLQ